MSQKKTERKLRKLVATLFEVDFTAIILSFTSGTLQTFSRGARMALFGHLIHPKAHLHNVQPSGRFVFDFPVLSVFSQSCLRQLDSVSETDEPVTCNITTTDIWGWPNLSIKCKFGMSKRKKNNCSMVTCI